MSLPKPILTDDDIVVVKDGSYLSAGLIWNAWSKDPIKVAVIQAVLACMACAQKEYFSWDMASALRQNKVCYAPSFHCK